MKLQIKSRIMIKPVKRLSRLLLNILLLFILSMVSVHAADGISVPTSAKQAYITDFATGQVLLEKMHEPR